MSGIAREIRHSVYLTGGLVLLAFGILEIGGGLSQVLGCALQANYCTGRDPSEFVAQVAPPLIGAAVLVVIAIVLLLMARNTLRGR